MNQAVIITPLLIDRSHTIRYFQISLPRKTANVTGVYTSIRPLRSERKVAPGQELPPVRAIADFAAKAREAKPNMEFGTLAGEIRLQSLEEANLFYTGHVFADGLSPDPFDFTTRPLKPTLWSHGKKFKPDPVKIEGETTLIEGLYWNRLDQVQQGTLVYEAVVYLWYELQNKTS